MSSQYTHRETAVYREFCSCRNQLTPHSAGVCQWCKKGSSQQLSNEGVIRLDRKGQVLQEKQS